MLKDPGRAVLWVCRRVYSVVFVFVLAQATRRDWYDRTVDNVCPRGTQQVGLLCYDNCRAGYAPGRSTDNVRKLATSCYVTPGTGQSSAVANGCPRQFPKLCSDGIAIAYCTEPQVSCEDAFFTAVYKTCF